MSDVRVPTTVDAVFVDGAGSGRVTTHGAWAVVAVHYGGTAKDVLEVVATETGIMLGATHQQAELQAVIEALRWCVRNGVGAEIVSDSAYVADGVNQRWYDRWRTNGWLATRGAVANREQWETLVGLWETRGAGVSIRRVRGHGRGNDGPLDVKGNHLADRAADAARRVVAPARRPDMSRPAAAAAGRVSTPVRSRHEGRLAQRISLSHVPTSDRSQEPITQGDLVRLAEIARADRERMFARNPRWALYRDRLLAVALCQGAALHYVDRMTGVKDFDLWTFFAALPERPYPDPALYRRLRHIDYGPSEFGRRDEAEFSHYQGRRVDLLADSVRVQPGAQPAEAIRLWLTSERRDSPRYLAGKAVVLIEPDPGQVVWPV